MVTTPSPRTAADGQRGDLPRRWLLVGVAAAYVPVAFLGYGTDRHVDDVLRAGRLALDGDYEPSRGPGLAPFELAVGVLDRVGGAILVNLVTVGFALLALWALHRLLVEDGARWPGLAALVLAANPWFWIASTSLGEMTWAIALALAGVVAARGERRVLAGVLLGLAIGCRASMLAIVVAWLVAERTGAESARPPWGATVRTAAVAVLVGALCFVPPWLDAGRSFDFLESDVVVDGWGLQVGRFVVKNLATATILGAVALAVGARHLLAATRRRRLSPIVRFALGAIVLTELVFLRFPDKPVHLLPVVVGVALLAGAAPLANRRWLVVLVVAQLVSGLVGTTIAAPDEADGRESGRIALRPADGVIVNDLRCRLDDLDRGTWIDGDSAAERAEAEARADSNWTCQRDAWRDS